MENGFPHLIFNKKCCNVVKMGVSNEKRCKPEFNKELNYDLISKYNKIIFSNYNNLEICVKTNNLYDCNYKNNYSNSNFNQKVKLPKSLTHLTFSCEFNQKVKLPESLTHLTFGVSFNQ